MGASDSKLAFRKNVFRLNEEEGGIAENDDEYWNSFHTLPDSEEDIFHLISAKDIRKTIETKPKNIITLIKKVPFNSFFCLLSMLLYAN